jgi:hypothetical protein
MMQSNKEYNENQRVSSAFAILAIRLDEKNQFNKI